MVVTHIPFESNKKKADHMKMLYKVVYTWKHLPTEKTGGAVVWVWDKKDGQALIKLWNNPLTLDRWEYTLTRVEKVR